MKSKRGSDTTPETLIRSLRSSRSFDSLLDYYYSLRYDPGAEIELKELIETLVVQETYFFREADALEALVDAVIAEQLAQPRRSERTVRVWSAACATGEEPLTLAMMLDQRGMLDRVDIVASDISARGLERARQGIFGGRSLRAMPVAMRATYTTELPDGRVAIRPSLGSRIRWETLNLVDAGEVSRMGPFDAILCRNVMIYFGDETCRRVVTSLAAALRPTGVLLVGVSESLLRFGMLECHERGGTFFYGRTPV